MKKKKMVFENIQEIFDTFVKIWSASGTPISGLDRVLVKKLIKDGDNQGALDLMNAHHKKVEERGLDVGFKHSITIDGNMLLPSDNISAKEGWEDNTTATWGGQDGKELWCPLAVTNRTWKE